MAVGQVLRGMQRAGGEGWTAVVSRRLRGCGGGRLCCCVCVLPCAVCWSRRVLGRKNTTVKGFNVLNRIWG